MNSPERRNELNPYVISHQWDLTHTPEGVKAIEESYLIKKQAEHRDLHEFTEAVGTLITHVNEANPQVLLGAVTLARKIGLWDLEPEVRLLQESQSEAIENVAERAQVKRETEIFLGFKRYHVQREREKAIAENPYLIPPKVFQEVIFGLDLSFIDEDENQS